MTRIILIGAGAARMITVMKFSFLQILILAWALPAAAQSPAVEVRASAEYRISGADTPEAGKMLALAMARHDVLQNAATQLRNNAEVQAIALQANALESLLPAILVVEKEESRSERVANETLYQVRLK